MCIITLCTTAILKAQELSIGTASADITPKLPVALYGQFELRIAHTAETPLTANIVALESRKNGRQIDVAIMVSCDLIGIPYELINEVREAVHQRLPSLDVNKIFLNATHTHTSLVLSNDVNNWGYMIPHDSVTPVDSCRTYVVRQITEAIVYAWENRRPGSVTWGLSDAVVGYNRRVVYSDGTAKMYGKTNDSSFQNIEGYEDHDINSLFFWNNENKLIAIIINVACPAQEVEGRTTVNADYWHPVRKKLKQCFGAELCVLGWISAAGDQSPRPMYRRAAEERMITLRQINRLEEIARRIVRAVKETYEVVKSDQHTNVPLFHKVETIALPVQTITEKECAEARTISQEAANQIAADVKSADQLFSKMKWYGDVVTRFEKQEAGHQVTHEMELHVLRIGDVAICANEFEIFTDYGIRIKARSNAIQTFIVQLAGPDTYYLPTKKAVNGGSYSAIVESNLIGPKGGQILVDRLVELINNLWGDKK